MHLLINPFIYQMFTGQLTPEVTVGLAGESDTDFVSAGDSDRHYLCPEGVSGQGRRI